MGIRLYMALKLTGIPMLWLDKDDKSKGFSHDGALEIFGKQFFFEHETGSQFYKRQNKIRMKIKNYIDYFLTINEKKPNSRFHVIFTVTGYKHIKAKRYGDALLDMFRDYEMGSMFLMAPNKQLVADPLGSWLAHYNGSSYSFKTVR